MKKQKFTVTGMTCSACSSHVEKSVRKLAGMKAVTVNLLTNSMQVEYEEGICSEDKIIEAVEKAGYGAGPVTGGTSEGSGHPAGGEHPADANGLSERRLSPESSQVRTSGEDGRNRAGREALKGKKENREMKIRLGVSIVFMVLLMLVSMHHMFFMWLHLPVPEFLMRLFHGNENALTFAFTQFLLTLPILYVNRKYYQTGFKTLFHLSPNMDSLIAIGSGAALLYGVFAIYRIGYGLGHGEEALVSRYASDLYFESAGMILALITVGKYMETRSKGRTSEAIEKLMDLSPKTAVLLLESGEEKEIPTYQLLKDDLFVVKPGSLIPADGVVVEGNSSIDEAAITGESIPVEKQPGDTVVSATMNKAGRLVCRAVKVGEDTTLSQIIRLVEEASSSKAPIARMADQIAGIFVPAVMGIALITFFVWLAAGGGFEAAMSSAIAVLVISCPCALGLATPVAIMVGTGVGARNGILIKSGDALQSARDVDTVVLDKTGTITEGKPKVTDIFSYAEDMSEEEVLALAAAVEKPSEHPLAEAVVSEASGRGITVPAADDFQAVFGKGVTGVCRGKRVFAGNRKFMEENGIFLTREQQNTMEKLSEEGKTTLLFGIKDKWSKCPVSGGEEETQICESGGCQASPDSLPLKQSGQQGLAGVIAVADTVRESSVRAIKELQDMKIKVVMLTGDNRRTAQAVQKKLKIDQVVAEVLPKDKEQEIRRLQAEGRKVAMIGDGINDAPALAAADVGIAIGAGTDVALDSADIILMKSRLTDAITAIRLSRSVIRNIKENLFWAFFYNTIGIPLAAGALYPSFGIRLNPMFGAAAMSLSSLFVVGNALRLRNFRAHSYEDVQGERKSETVSNNNKEENPLLLQEQSHFASQNKEDWEMTKTITIEGMMCSHCTGRVQKALEEVAGVESVVMSLEEKTAQVTLKTDVADEVLKAAVTDAGYEVTDIK